MPTEALRAALAPQRGSQADEQVNRLADDVQGQRDNISMNLKHLNALLRSLRAAGVGEYRDETGLYLRLGPRAEVETRQAPRPASGEEALRKRLLEDVGLDPEHAEDLTAHLRWGA